jgi:lipoate-protein ligase A
VTRVRAAPDELLALGMPDPAVRLLRWCDADRPALVIGSTQPAPADDPGVHVVRRRSGGGAVMVTPGAVLWADVVVPAGDPLWADDVGVAPVWLGEAWAGALRRIGVPEPVVHVGPMHRSAWSATVCFAGVAAGEVTAGGRKIVGISQRRTRTAALFQCAALLRWEPPVPELADVAVGVSEIPGSRPDALVDALQENMP